MFFTPLDIQNAEFKKSMYGYSEEEVDSFLERVLNDYQELLREVDSLKGKVSILNDGLKQYKDMEASLKETLILAQHTAGEVRDSAIKKADNIVKEAELKSDEIVQGARYKLFALNQSLKELKMRAQSFKADYSNALAAELDLVTKFSIEIDDVEVDEIEIKMREEATNVAPIDLATTEPQAQAIIPDGTDELSGTYEPKNIDDLANGIFNETIEAEEQGFDVEVDSSIDVDDDFDIGDVADAEQAIEDTREDAKEDATDEMMDEDSKDTQESGVAQNVRNFFSGIREVDSSDNSVTDEYNKKMFGRRLARQSEDDVGSEATKEYKPKFLSDIEKNSEEKAESKSNRKDQKTNEVKKWFLDD